MSYSLNDYSSLRCVASSSAQDSSDLLNSSFYFNQPNSGPWLAVDTRSVLYPSIPTVPLTTSQDFASSNVYDASRFPTSQSLTTFPSEPADLPCSNDSDSGASGSLVHLFPEVTEPISFASNTQSCLPDPHDAFDELLDSRFSDSTAGLSNSPLHRSLSQSSRSRSTSAAAAAPRSSIHTAKTGRKRAFSPENETHADRRRRNNAAAAKYRQKKVDRITDLEKALDEASSERDLLKVQLAKRDAEVDLLRRLLSEKS